MDASGESNQKLNPFIHAYPTVITKILHSIISSRQPHRLACMYIHALDISSNEETPECVNWVWADCAVGNTSLVGVLTHCQQSEYIPK